jgi:hypothetical protein
VNLEWKQGGERPTDYYALRYGLYRVSRDFEATERWFMTVSEGPWTSNQCVPSNWEGI